MAELLLVRHAQSAWNVEGRWQGQADPPLSAAGEEQARTAAAELGGFELVAASDLVRARRTAEIIAEVLGLAPVEVLPALRERDVGEWSGLTGEEVDAAYPGFRASGRRPPGWEDNEALIARVVPALAELTESGAKTTLVVTHGGVLHALQEHLGVTHDRSIANLAGRWLSVNDGSLAIGPAVDLLAVAGSVEPSGPS